MRLSPRTILFTAQDDKQSLRFTFVQHLPLHRGRLNLAAVETYRNDCRTWFNQPFLTDFVNIYLLYRVLERIN